MNIVYIDHYDSFSFNVIDWLEKMHQDVNVLYFQYDKEGLYDELLGKSYPIVLSPGPNSPHEAKPTLKIVEESLHKVPILGVCLGHQILGFQAGASTIPAQNPIHGVLRNTYINNSRFLNLDKGKLELAVYNSLVVSDRLSSDWLITGRNDENEIQLMENWRNPNAPAIGIQAHPESFLSSSGPAIAKAWLQIVSSFYS